MEAKRLSSKESTEWQEDYVFGFSPSVRACGFRKCNDLRHEEYPGVGLVICGVNGEIIGSFSECPKDDKELHTSKYKTTKDTTKDTKNTP